MGQEHKHTTKPLKVAMIEVGGAIIDDIRKKKQAGVVTEDGETIVCLCGDVEKETSRADAQIFAVAGELYRTVIDFAELVVSRREKGMKEVNADYLYNFTKYRFLPILEKAGGIVDNNLVPE